MTTTSKTQTVNINKLTLGIALVFDAAKAIGIDPMASTAIDAPAIADSLGRKLGRSIGVAQVRSLLSAAQVRFNAPQVDQAIFDATR
jgi:hypothetical protein